MIVLEAKEKTKEETGKKFAKQIRNEGRVPAVIYGEKQTPISISLDPVNYIKQLTKSNFKKNQLFEINIDDKQKENVITKEIKVNPINNQVIHIDFLRVQDDHAIQINVPIRAEGVSAGQRLGGVLVKPKSTVKVKCLPNDIPVDIEVDVTHLKIGENIRTEDLKLTGSQSVISNPKDILIKVESTKISKAASATAEDGSNDQEAGANTAEA